jgi:hypothetical protein
LSRHEAQRLEQEARGRLERQKILDQSEAEKARKELLELEAMRWVESWRRKRGPGTCNPSYSGGRDLEDRSSKPAWTSSLQDPISKIPITKKGWWSGSRCSPSSNPSTAKEPGKAKPRVLGKMLVEVVVCVSVRAGERHWTV